MGAQGRQRGSKGNSEMELKRREIPKSSHGRRRRRRRRLMGGDDDKSGCLLTAGARVMDKLNYEKGRQGKGRMLLVAREQIGRAHV